MTEPTTPWPLRAVVKASAPVADALWWDLELACGHTVMSTQPEVAKVTGILCPECCNEMVAESRR